MASAAPARQDMLVAALSLLGGIGACTGSIENDGQNDYGNYGGGGRPGSIDDGTGAIPVPPGLPGREMAATVGLRRLTAREYDDTVNALLGPPNRSAVAYLPTDISRPFDNDYVQQLQQISDSLVEGVELLAGDIAAELMGDVHRRDKIVGCLPKDPDCLRSFIVRFGRQVLRRPLRPEEITVYLELEKAVGGDLYTAVEAIVRTMLQEPEFFYRVEIGTPVKGTPGLFKLDNYEVATRLSYFLWGKPPSDDLLARAEKGGLSTPEQIRGMAQAMLAEPAAVDRVTRFHGQWLNYLHLTTPPVPAMQDETKGLIKKVIFDDKRPWQDLFRSNETLVTFELARNYGMAVPPGLKPGSKPAWVTYGRGTSSPAARRQGILSHASFLSIGAKFGDTSPTVRGKAMREGLLCQDIPPPPDNVDSDNPPKAAANSPCKWDSYKLSRESSPVCNACHILTDLLGFGIENYDTGGRYRANNKDPETGRPLGQCRIAGEGQLDGQAFVGPAGLSDLLAVSPQMNACAMKQLYRFATSRTELDDNDQKFIAIVVERIGKGDFRFDEAILDFVSSESFAYRRPDGTLK